MLSSRSHLQASAGAAVGTSNGRLSPVIFEEKSHVHSLYVVIDTSSQGPRTYEGVAQPATGLVVHQGRCADWYLFKVVIMRHFQCMRKLWVFWLGFFFPFFFFSSLVVQSLDRS